jgi:type I restriction enzyme M protein
LNAHFGVWRERMAQRLRSLQIGLHPKALIEEIAEDLLAHCQGQPLVDAYGVYQQLMDYWAQTMQDDAYLIAADGWKAEARADAAREGTGRSLRHAAATAG